VTQRVAAIDCGTNSIRLLIADLRSKSGDSERVRGDTDPARPSPAPLTDLTRAMRIVRLGEGVDRTGRLSEAALDRTMTALREYAGLIADARPEAVRMVATSATRDAVNSLEFTERVIEILGVEPEVITGNQEAWLSFTGATRELAGTPLAAWDSCPPPYLVTDIGGGSTEFVLGGPDGVAGARSVNIGCVRLTERHLHGDPPLPVEIAATVEDIDAALGQAAAAVSTEKARTLVGLAGSVTTVAAIALGLEAYDSARIHHARITAARVHEIADDLLAMTRAERAAIPVMHPGRVDVIGAGALILDRIMASFGFAEVLVSEHDILDGIAWSLVQLPPSSFAVGVVALEPVAQDIQARFEHVVGQGLGFGEQDLDSQQSRRRGVQGDHPRRVHWLPPQAAEARRSNSSLRRSYKAVRSAVAAFSGAYCSCARTRARSARNSGSAIVVKSLSSSLIIVSLGGCGSLGLWLLASRRWRG
jgi:exopolyphosphatase/guanosine-5'-triphosphate,3'-diphosphate pyrophosphatase